MNSARLIVLLCSLSFATPGWTQQAANLQTPTRDQQALAVLDQALNVAGGAAAVTAIQDYTALGIVTYHWGEKDVEGTVNISGRHRDQLRMDTTLPTGVRSWIASRGGATEKSENGKVLPVWDFHSLSPSSFIFPYAQLASALKPQLFSVTYVGLVEIDGHSAHEIRIQRAPELSADQSQQVNDPEGLDYFIDASSSQVLMTRDTPMPSANGAQAPLHEVRYSDYRTVGNVQFRSRLPTPWAGRPLR